jgi:hypothetical protein
MVRLRGEARMHSRNLAILTLLLISATLVGCVSTGQYHGELYFEQLVGHKAVTEKELADSHTCAQQTGLGTTSHVLLAGAAMGTAERSKMKSCLRDHGYEIK